MVESLGGVQWALTESGGMVAISSGIGGGLGAAIMGEDGRHSSSSELSNE